MKRWLTEPRPPKPMAFWREPSVSKLPPPKAYLSLSELLVNSALKTSGGKVGGPMNDTDTATINVTSGAVRST
jgi:hypothetical protein